MNPNSKNLIYINLMSGWNGKNFESKGIADMLHNLNALLQL